MLLPVGLDGLDLPDQEWRNLRPFSFFKHGNFTLTAPAEMRFHGRYAESLNDPTEHGSASLWQVFVVGPLRVWSNLALDIELKAGVADRRGAAKKLVGVAGIKYEIFDTGLENDANHN